MLLGGRVNILAGGRPKSMVRNRSELIEEIELLRKNLENIIETKNDRTASEVLAISEALDEVINNYYRPNPDDSGVKENVIRLLYPDS